MYLSNEHIYSNGDFTNHAITQPRPFDANATYYKCYVCRSIGTEPTINVKRAFDTVEACPKCVEKIAIGREQLAAYRADKMTDNQQRLRDCIYEENGGPQLTCDDCYQDFEAHTGVENQIAIKADNAGWVWLADGGDVLCCECNDYRVRESEKVLPEDLYFGPTVGRHGVK
jgi:hypothetical protein